MPEEIMVPCPTCGKKTVYSLANPSRPFCGKACKNEDLVAWADGRYRLPSHGMGDQEDEEAMQAPEDEES